MKFKKYVKNIELIFSIKFLSEIIFLIYIENYYEIKK